MKIAADSDETSEHASHKTVANDLINTDFILPPNSILTAKNAAF